MYATETFNIAQTSPKYSQGWEQPDYHPLLLSSTPRTYGFAIFKISVETSLPVQLASSPVCMRPVLKGEEPCYPRARRWRPRSPGRHCLACAVGCLAASMPYSLLLDEIFQISAGKSLLVQNPDLLISVVASAFSNLLDTPLWEHLSRLLSVLSASSHHLMDCLTIAEAIPYLLSRRSQHSAECILHVVVTLMQVF